MKATVNIPTIAIATEGYIQFIRQIRSENTALTYGKALKELKKTLITAKIDPDNSPVSELTEGFFAEFVLHLRATAPSTEQLYVGVVLSFFKHLVGEGLLGVNLPRLQLIAKQHKRRSGIRLPRITIRDVEHVLDFISNVDLVSEGFETERLRALRDRAFLLTLADTGLRVHEACELKRGDINWSSETAVIVKRGKKEIIRFTSRSMHALKEYLTLRAELDGASGKQLTALPLFARHDKGTGKKIKPITPTTGRNIVAQRVKQALGEDTEGHITPHSFRHYFVSTILRSSGNLKLAQTLARHENMQITQRYAHIDDDELDKGYYEIFEKRERSE
jgi:integrase/recombinase XerC